MNELLYTRNTNKELLQRIPVRFDHMELLDSDTHKMLVEDDGNTEITVKCK